MMRALVLTRHDTDLKAAIAGLRVESRPRPEPKHGQVLVRIEAAPCNPSDLLFLRNRYGAFKSLPSVPGWEGAGTVVSAGGGLLARWLVGKRVACGLQSDRDGTWAEYFVANAMECLPLKKGVSIEQGASLLINPLTAVAILQEARRGGHAAAVHTAAASQVGRMIVGLANRRNYPVIHVVRRQAQVELLRSLGAEYVLNSSDEGFQDELRDRCKKLRASVSFDAVGGQMTGQVLHAMPPDSVLFLYGALADDPSADFDPIDVIFHRKRIRGFYLADWMKRKNLLSVVTLTNQVQNMVIDGTIQTDVYRNVTLEEAIDGLLQYVDNMTAGKLLIRPFA